MYASQFGERRLTFAVSGLLWRRSLVMKDSQTESLWSHLLGRCMEGELHGAQLQVLPSVITDWATWRRVHPETTVMTLPDSGQGFEKEIHQNRDDFVLGFAGGGQARAWGFAQLAAAPLVNDVFDGQQLVILFDPASGGGWGYRRTVTGRILEFEDRDGQIVDRQTGSTWDLMKGLAVSGPLSGSRLEPIPLIISFRVAWEEFHPRSQYWKPAAGD